MQCIQLLTLQFFSIYPEVSNIVQITKKGNLVLNNFPVHLQPHCSFPNGQSSFNPSKAPGQFPLKKPSQGKSRGRSPRDFPRAQAIFHRIPQLSSQYSHSQLPLLVNNFSYSDLLLRGGPIFSRIGLPEEAQYRPVLPLGGIRTRIAPAEDSGSGALGNTLCLEGNIATAIFQYSIVR